jgi:predicted acyltransferase
MQVDKKEGAAKKKKRVVSLDVFRGMCITIMIFVNYGGGKFPSPSLIKNNVQ